MSQKNNMMDLRKYYESLGDNQGTPQSHGAHEINEEWSPPGITVLDDVSGGLAGVKGFTWNDLVNMMPSDYDELKVKFDDGSHLITVKGVSVVEDEKGRQFIVFHM